MTFGNPDDYAFTAKDILNEWKEENKTFYDWCVKNLENVDDAVEVETDRQRRETFFLNFE